MSDGVPEFAVVGRVNMGKSAVIATLLEIDDNEVLRVSPTPGETTRCAFGWPETLSSGQISGASRGGSGCKKLFKCLIWRKA